MANLTQDFDKVQGIIIKTVEENKNEFDQTVRMIFSGSFLRNY